MVLEEGSVGSHAAIVARALAIPLVIHAERIKSEALNGDLILVDGDQGIVHLRPEETVVRAFGDKIAMQAEAQKRYASLKGLPAQSRDGTVTALHMNAGLMADLPSLEGSGAEGVGLFRTELQFLIRSQMPKRAELARLYARVMDAAKGRRVAFRTLDIGSDKVLPYMKPQDEPNPAMGWRAIRVGLDKPGVLRMQLQALIRAANGRPLTVMFPFIAQIDEFTTARDHALREIEREAALGHPVPEKIEIGAMLETPSLAYAPKCFFDMVDFISIGGNDLKQFFFAADRENELVRRRYDTLNSGVPALPRPHRAALRRGRHAAFVLRRGCGTPHRGAVPRRHGHPHPLDAPRLHRPGQEPLAPGGPARGARRDRRGDGDRRAIGAACGDGVAVDAAGVRVSYVRAGGQPPSPIGPRTNGGPIGNPPGYL